jgi:hypothetical protein
VVSATWVQGALKQMGSSATVWLGICSEELLVSIFHARHVGPKLFHSAAEVTTKDCSVTQSGRRQMIFGVTRALSGGFDAGGPLVRLESREMVQFPGRGDSLAVGTSADPRS